MKTDVLVVGAGPAGLAAAVELRRLGAGRVLVVDRDDEPGGIPRHCHHTGFGIRDMRRFLSGPAYARHYVHAAAAAGAEIWPAATVTGWDGLVSAARDGAPSPSLAEATLPDHEDLQLTTVLASPDNALLTGSATGTPVDRAPLAFADAPSPPASVHRVSLTSEAGVETVEASAVLLATGCRERPRSARLVPGDRPPGVMTTGELQRRVYLHGQRLRGRALIVGAEHVSFSAMVTLAHAGSDVVALITDQPRHSSYALFAAVASRRWHVPVWTSTVVLQVIGRDRLEGVELRDATTGLNRFVRCDTLVFTGDWIPDHELARLAGLDTAPGTRGPVVDTALETSGPMVFAAGNLVHAGETADIAALGGRHAARQMAAALGGLLPAPALRLPVTVAPPLAWIAPSAVRVPGPRPSRGRFLLRGNVFRRFARAEVWQGERRVATSRPFGLIPNRPAHMSGNWVHHIDPDGGPITVRLR
jgi:thioredoxin reductase